MGVSPPSGRALAKALALVSRRTLEDRFVFAALGSNGDGRCDEMTCSGDGSWMGGILMVGSKGSPSAAGSMLDTRRDCVPAAGLMMAQASSASPGREGCTQERAPCSSIGSCGDQSGLGWVGVTSSPDVKPEPLPHGSCSVVNNELAREADLGWQSRADWQRGGGAVGFRSFTLVRRSLSLDCG